MTWPAPLFALDYPLWLRATHYANLLFLTVLIRSGLEIFSAHPKLYWNDGCAPGTEWFNVNWLLFRRSGVPSYALLPRIVKRHAGSEIWTSSDEETPFPSWLALPGGGRLGLGRHWHFLGDLTWILTGIAYYALLFATGEYHRLIPASWSVFPQAARDLAVYAHFVLVETPGGYNALQTLAYAGVVFGLAPLTIATGLAMSPSLTARFPGYLKIFGGRQAARSIHFLCLLAWLVFLTIHVAMVIAHGFVTETAKISLGETVHPDVPLTIAAVSLGLFAILLFHIVATEYSIRRPARVAERTGTVIDYAREVLFGYTTSRQHYTSKDVSPYFRVNGRPPKDPEWVALSRTDFRDYRLIVGGLVRQPRALTLADLRGMPRQTQITKHCCIQGWSAVAEWGGVPLRRILEMCEPLPSARWIALFAYDNKAETEPEPTGSGCFYGTIDPRLARDPQTILAYEMNGEPLPIVHGAPLRLRVETQLGFMMVKYIRTIELIDDYRKLGLGRGGWREDHQFYSPQASI